MFTGWTKTNRIVLWIYDITLKPIMQCKNETWPAKRPLHLLWGLDGATL